MTALKERLKQLIATTGPISVSEYMAICLFDPTDGYYTTREPFGASGDFITSPEISQMFGELLGVWTYSAWIAAGKPVPFTFAEIGPGRGTLMIDMLRTIDRLDPGFIATARIALVEASPRLTEPTMWSGERWGDGNLVYARYNHALPPLAPSCLLGGSTDYDSPIVSSASSRHPGGVNLLLADGGVRFIKVTINPTPWRGMATIAGSETWGVGEY